MYLVFGFDTYYPSGGWHDLLGTAASLKKAHKVIAKDKAQRWHKDNYHIVEIGNGIVHWE